MEKYEVIISLEDMNNLERLHYEVESRTNLFTRFMTSTTNPGSSNDFYNKFMNEYTDIYKKYCEAKEQIELKYKPAEIANTAKSWYADFIKRVIIFEV